MRGDAKVPREHAEIVFLSLAPPRVKQAPLQPRRSTGVIGALLVGSGGPSREDSSIQPLLPNEDRGELGGMGEGGPGRGCAWLCIRSGGKATT